MDYPVSVEVAPSLTGRNRLTTFFRLILAIPHLILVGGAGTVAASRGDRTTTVSGESGLLGAVAWFLAVVSWFTIVFGGVHLPGIRQFTTFYLRWRLRVLGYVSLLQDPYPPFGDGPYPTELTVTDPAGPRNRLTVAFRLLLVLPHVVLLFFVLVAWLCTTVIAWFAILFTARMPEGLHRFGTGALRWRLRVEAYMLLLVDDYPPFGFTN
ncbi:MAG: DUF4389 domain-containing protein [Vicinamibacterales bacterium]